MEFMFRWRQLNKSSNRRYEPSCRCLATTGPTEKRAFLHFCVENDGWEMITAVAFPQFSVVAIDFLKLSAGQGFLNIFRPTSSWSSTFPFFSWQPNPDLFGPFYHFACIREINPNRKLPVLPGWGLSPRIKSTSSLEKHLLS